MTARSYLFAASSDDVALTRLIATAASVTGFMDGAPGGPLPGWYYPGRDNAGMLAELYGRLAQAYPKAGKPFYAVRLWTNLVWQPAYLAVIAVHVHGALPALSTLSQQAKGIYISGYRLPPGPQYSDTLENLIIRAGKDLRAFADAGLAEVNAIVPLKRLPALRLLTERMLSLMLRLDRYAPGTTIARQREFCALWLKAMGLTGHGDLETLDLDDGSQVLITARKGCCLDYLAFPQTYCASCPKQDDALRLARQREGAIAERVED